MFPSFSPRGFSFKTREEGEEEDLRSRRKRKRLRKRKRINLYKFSYMEVHLVSNSPQEGKTGEERNSLIPPFPSFSCVFLLLILSCLRKEVEGRGRRWKEGVGGGMKGLKLE